MTKDSDVNEFDFGVGETFLGEADYEVFFNALHAPPEPTDKLRAAFRRYKIRKTKEGL